MEDFQNHWIIWLLLWNKELCLEVWACRDNTKTDRLKKKQNSVGLILEIIHDNVFHSWYWPGIALSTLVIDKCVHLQNCWLIKWIF